MSILREFGYRSYTGSKKSRIYRLWSLSTFDVLESWKRSKFSKILVIVLAVWQIVVILLTLLLSMFISGAGVGISTLEVYDSIEVPGGANDVKFTYFGFYYLAQSNGLLILDSNYKPNSTYLTSSPINSLEIDLGGMITYLNLGDMGIEILDTSVPSFPNSFSTLSTPGTVMDIVPLNGSSGLPGWLFIADGDSGLQVANVSNPFLPSIVKTIDTAGTANALAIREELLFVADGNNGLIIMNITVPNQPTVVSQIATPKPAFDVAVAGNYTFVSMKEEGVLVINTAFPTNPYQLGFVDTPGSANQIAALGNNYAIVADGNEGIHAIYVPVNNPSNPKILVSENTTSYARAITLVSIMAGLSYAEIFIAEQNGIEHGTAQMTEDLLEQAGLGDPKEILWTFLTEVVVGLSGLLIMALIAVLAGGLIANDRRNRTFDLYLTRVEAHEYMLGKFLAVFSISTLLMFATGLVQIVSFVVLQNFDLLANLDIPIAFFILVIVASAVESSLILALSSLTDRSLYAAIGFFFGHLGLNLVAGMSIAVNALTTSTFETRTGYLSLISPMDLYSLFGATLRGRLVEVSTVEPWTVLIALGGFIIIGWAVIIYSLMFRRE
ncbi:MAG: hypothetical protein ACFFBD_00900 [Candidatus Hodarchaeota archaeon]